MSALILHTTNLRGWHLYRCRSMFRKHTSSRKKRPLSWFIHLFLSSRRFPTDHWTLESYKVYRYCVVLHESNRLYATHKVSKLSSAQSVGYNQMWFNFIDSSKFWIDKTNELTNYRTHVKNGVYYNSNNNFNIVIYFLNLLCKWIYQHWTKTN